MDNVKDFALSDALTTAAFQLDSELFGLSLNHAAEPFVEHYCHDSLSGSLTKGIVLNWWDAEDFHQIAHYDVEVSSC